MRRILTTLLAPAAAVLLALPLLAVTRPEDGLSLVPADAATVGVVHLADLRSSPLAARLFSETDKVTCDGDGARFMEEAGLRPKEDVDIVTVAFTPGPNGKSDGSALVAFEGRFDPERLAAAVAARGGLRTSVRGGDYFQLVDKNAPADRRSGAVAFVSRHLVLAGNETAVARALGEREAGGSGFRAGAGLGRQLSRVESGASAFSLVDVARFPRARDAAAKVHAEVEGSGQGVAALVGTMKSVSLLVLQATAKGDALKVAATGLSPDEETRELMEDALRGLTAAWRLSVQEKSPDLVAAIRKFKVSRDREGVTISGTLSGELLRSFLERGKTAEKR